MNDPNRLVLVAKVAGAFGVRGEVRIRAYTDNPLALLNYRELRRADGTPGLTLVAGRSFKDGLIARAREIATKEEADAMKGLDLFAPRSAMPEVDEDEEYYLADLIGLAAVSPDGEVLGTVRGVPNFGAGDLLEIAPPRGQTWLVAFTREAVPEIDIAGGRVVVVRPAESD